MSLPVRLASTPLDKVWGSPRTEPWYRRPEGTEIPESGGVGEVWFDASDEVPILVKLLFTSENLSVQVHPGDEYARQHENSCGKTEMWHILRAEPGAKVGLGLREPLSRERLRDASVSGEIERLLRWIPVRAGDTFFSPAGTIHALGAGLAVCEVQQLSDVTYRLYDYGRGRELHLDHGVNVAILEPWDGKVTPVSLGEDRELLVQCEYFRTERLRVKGSVPRGLSPANTIYVALEGEGSIAGQPFRTGEAWEVRRDSEPFLIESRNAVFLITSVLPLQ